jgi:hypothetical protein
MKRIDEEMNDSPVAGMMKDPGPPADSLDSEIDARIVRYESESLKSEDDQESDELMESLANLSLGFLLEEEEATPEKGAKPADATKDDAKEPRLPLDIEVFTSKIARLVNNATDLLPVQEVIVARAMKYLRENYDQSYVDQMQDILDNQYGFDLDGEDDIIDVPIAPGAAGKGSAGG